MSGSTRAVASRSFRAGTPDSALSSEDQDVVFHLPDVQLKQLTDLAYQMRRCELKIDQLSAQVDRILDILGPQLHTVRHYRNHYENLDLGI